MLPHGGRAMARLVFTPPPGPPRALIAERALGFPPIAALLPVCYTAGVFAAPAWAHYTF